MRVHDRQSSPLPFASFLIGVMLLGHGATQAQNATTIHAGGRYPRYNATVGKVAFDMRVADFGDVDIYLMNLDGSGQVGPVTDDTPGVRHKGQPYWYPDGRHIIFTAEQDGYARNSAAGYVEQPGLGRNHNVWIMTADGSRYWQITAVEENGSHIRASFSDDGTKVMWNEEYSMEMDARGCSWRDREPTHPGWEYCNFRIAWSEFHFDGWGDPRLARVHQIDFFDEAAWLANESGSHTDDVGLYILEAQGFSRDGERIIFTACNPYEVWQRTGDYTCRYGGDYYTTNLDGTELVRLTDSTPGHKENAEYSPDGASILFTRTGDTVGAAPEWYLMNSDGSDFPGTRVTFFTDPYHQDHVENAFGGEGDWVDDSTFLVNVPWYETSGTTVYLSSDIWRLDNIPRAERTPGLRQAPRRPQGRVRP